LPTTEEWKAELTLVGKWQLMRCVCVDVVGLRNGWQIISPSKSFTVYAATASEKTEWMAHIEKCAQDLLTKRKLKLPLDFYAGQSF